MELLGARDEAGPSDQVRRMSRAITAAQAAQLTYGPIFSALNETRVLAQASALNQLTRAGVRLPLHGMSVSVKDLFDVQGEPTLCGSRAREQVSPATADAEAVQRLRAAGVVMFGRTTMTEFAYSGLGVNPYHGTPRNPRFDVDVRIPGGSSSGAAVSVAAGLVDVALCSDTGGSARIPAALCGIVGFKPTQSSVSRKGMFPLSSTLDSVGLMATTLDDVARVFGVLSSQEVGRASQCDLQSLRICVIEDFFFDSIQANVLDAFEESLRRLSEGGVKIVRISGQPLAQVGAINVKGGFQAAEAYATHHDELSRSDCRIDSRVATRIRRGATQSALDYLTCVRLRAELIAEFWPLVDRFDVIAVPTVPVAAPTFSSIERDEEYFSTNLLLLRNPSVVNLLDGCAVSMPNRGGETPTGLMLIGRRNADLHLLNAAKAVERCLIEAHPRQ